MNAIDPSIYREALRWLRNGAGWTKGSSFNIDSNGRVCMCLGGAIGYAATGQPGVMDLPRYLWGPNWMLRDSNGQPIPDPSVAHYIRYAAFAMRMLDVTYDDPNWDDIQLAAELHFWNDAPERTWTDVKSLLEKLCELPLIEDINSDDWYTLTDKAWTEPDSFTPPF